MSEYSPNQTPQPSTIGVSGQGAAGVLLAVSLTPTNAALTAKLCHVTVAVAQVATVANGLFTISGLSTAAGGTLNYQLVQTVAAGGYLDIYFDPPLPASGANTAIVGTLAAVSGGGLSTITMTGWQA